MFELAWRNYGWAAAKLITTIADSCRWQILDFHHYLRLLKSGKPFIFALWHGRQFLLAYTFRQGRVRILVSKSRDGELISRPLNRLGLCTVRGSTSRGGHEAYLKLGEFLAAGHTLAITPDGPRGPAGTVAPGIVAIAKNLKAPILPLTTSARTAWYANSWDRFLVPAPFTSVVLAFGPPVIVPQSASDQELLAIRGQLKQKLDRITSLADQLAQGGDPGEADLTCVPGRGLRPLALYRSYRLAKD